jgi:hypothetical protein
MGCCSLKSKEVRRGTRLNTVMDNLKRNYKISSESRILGAGQFGKVFLSESIANPDLKVAIKVINKEKVKDNLE